MFIMYIYMYQTMITKTTQMVMKWWLKMVLREFPTA